MLTVKELKGYYHKGRFLPYSWPGCYPIFALTTDGGVLCPDCMTKERARIFRSTHEIDNDGFTIAGVDINYEDTDLPCDHCGSEIETAYAD